MPAQQKRSANLLLFPGCDPKAKLTQIYFKDRINDKAELVILNWLVALPTAIDPAYAAQSLLLNLDDSEQKLSKDQQNLLALLREIANHPRQKLEKISHKGRRDQRRKSWLRQTRQKGFF